MHLARVIALLAALFSGATGGAEKPAAAPPAFTFTDSTGHPCTPLAIEAGSKATVLIFLMADCPVANATAPALARLVEEFAPQGIRFHGIYATETDAEIEKHRRSHGLTFPCLRDPRCRLARHAGATRVPESVVFSPAGVLLYRGRIDDRAIRPGLTRPVPQREDLRLALTAVLAGRAPGHKFAPAIGCHLPLE